jgi:ferritin-like metal-binding protein YciE
MSRRDINSVVSAALCDLAAVQQSTQSRWGYKRAAAAIARLDLPITELVRRLEGETGQRRYLMASIDSLHTLLVSQLRDIYDAEKRLTKAIPKLAKAATNDALRSALEDHLEETQTQISRLEEAFEHLGETAKAKPCAGMRGIIEEGDEHVNEDYDDDDLRDAVIIGSAQRVEHYEIAAYGTAMAHAKLLNQKEVISLLKATIEEEKAADKKLTQIAESVVNIEAASGDQESAEMSAAFMGRKRSTVSQRATAAAKPAGSRKRSGKTSGRSRRSR